MSNPSPKKGGGIYWTFKHSKDGLWRFFKRHKLIFITLLVVIAVFLFTGRAYIHHLVIAIRIRSFAIIFAAMLLALAWWVIRKWPKLYRYATLAVVAIALLLSQKVIVNVHDYLSLYYRYKTLKIYEPGELPVTGHERIHPLNSVYSLALEVMTEVEQPTLPSFVRIGDDYRWIMAIEPSYPISRLFGGISEIYSVTATGPSPNFSRENRLKVAFETGESLLMSHNTKVSVIRSFGLWRFLHYEPSDITYFLDDKEEWVQVVSLIRWRGIFFPRPEFGGVQIIRQRKHNPLRTAWRSLFGIGEWVKPKEISKHEFLVGQNILSTKVSRYVANSLRFQDGFFAPFPGYHRGDVRIPDLPEDINDQPFAAFFTMPGLKGELLHYFSLEPYDPDKQGLNTSLFVPADGTERVFVYRHHRQTGTLTGVSAISGKVMQSMMNYDWDRNTPVEHRPFIRNIGGQTRFFWLTTVVTRTESAGNKRFIGGSIPQVVITDARYNIPVWVNVLNPDSWLEEIEAKLTNVWAQE